jgi:molybdenum cofactor synthesis domain-containing protein
MLPNGADYVIPVEDTDLTDGTVAVKSTGRPGQNIVRRGADVAIGTRVISKGRRLRSIDLGMLKTLGVRTVSVRRMLVGIMSTGNELTDSSHAIAGKIVDTNRIVLSSMVAELGATPVDIGIVRDREAQLLTALRRAVGSCDMVLVTVGSSVGTRDLVPKCISKLGGPGLLVHGVAMRPSMPTGLGLVNGVPIMSLPGVPVSAVFAFQVFGRPAITKMLGLPEPSDHVVKAKLAGSIRHPRIPGVRKSAGQEGP